MFNLVIKQLLHDRANTVLTVLALAGAFTVVLILQSFEQGQYDQLRQVIENRDTDLVVTQAKVQNFIAARSVIPQNLREQIEQIPGVDQAHPLTTLPIIYKNNQQQTPVYLLVYDSSGGPKTLIEGDYSSLGRGIVIDKALAKRYQLQIGSPFIVSNFEFTVSGITQEAAFMMPFAFINYDGMLDLFFESEIAPDLSTFPLLSFLLIDVAPTASISAVAAEIEKRFSDVDVLTPARIAQNDVSLGKSFYKPVVGLLILVGLLLGILLIAFLMVSFLQRRERDFSVLLALGGRQSGLFAYVVNLSLIMLILAFAIALLFATVLAELIETARPVYYFSIFNTDVLIKIGVIALCFALVASILSYYKVKRCDPAMSLKRLST